ncbi:MAG TPA: START domain-containing protein [Pseudomonadales bacterium]|nr:START domain-containing protein [Pseudomonadales bacterium]
MRKTGWFDRLIKLAIGGLMFWSLAALAEDNWKLVKDEDGIKVYTQPVEGSNFLEFKGVADLDASLPQCAGLVMSIPHMPKWMYGTTHAEQVSAVSDVDRVIYMVQHAPFPLKDRDLYVHNTLTQNADNSVVYAMDLMPEKAIDSKYVHVKKLHTRVTMIALSANKTHVEYRAHVDPGGKVPSWAANLVVTDTPFNTLKQAQEIIKTTKDSLTLSSVKNPY